MAGRASGFRSYHFCWRVVAPILRRARPAGPLRGPRGIRIRQPARMKAAPSGFRRRVRLPLSLCPSGVCGFRHALRSGPHGGAGARLPLVWPVVAGADWRGWRVAAGAWRRDSRASRAMQAADAAGQYFVYGPWWPGPIGADGVRRPSQFLQVL